jgi:hypothetical protein
MRLHTKVLEHPKRWRHHSSHCIAVLHANNGQLQLNDRSFVRLACAYMYMQSTDIAPDTRGIESGRGFL